MSGRIAVQGEVCSCDVLDTTALQPCQVVFATVKTCKQRTLDSPRYAYGLFTLCHCSCAVKYICMAQKQVPPPHAKPAPKPITTDSQALADCSSLDRTRSGELLTLCLPQCRGYRMQARLVYLTLCLQLPDAHFWLYKLSCLMQVGQELLDVDRTSLLSSHVLTKAMNHSKLESDSVSYFAGINMQLVSDQCDLCLIRAMSVATCVHTTKPVQCGML